MIIKKINFALKMHCRFPFFLPFGAMAFKFCIKSSSRLQSYQPNRHHAYFLYVVILFKHADLASEIYSPCSDIDVTNLDGPPFPLLITLYIVACPRGGVSIKPPWATGSDKTRGQGSFGPFTGG